MNNLPYYPISKYYKEKYGEKVYKLPIKLDITCPIEMEQFLEEVVFSVVKVAEVLKTDLNG